jgi:hypothetical protein
MIRKELKLDNFIKKDKLFSLLFWRPSGLYLVMTVLLANSQRGTGHHMLRDRENACVCVAFLQSHQNLIMGVLPMSLPNPHHFSKALPLNIIVGLSSHPLNTLPWDFQLMSLGGTQSNHLYIVEI